MDFPNSVIPEPVNTDNLVPSGADPFSVGNPNAGLLDLVQSPSTASSMPANDPFASGIMPQGKASSGALAAPIFFDAEKSQVDRYTSSDYYGQLGFNPLEGYGNEYKYGSVQTWGDAMGTALGGAWQLGKNTFVQGWKGWGRMASAIGNWDSSKLIADSPDELYDMNKTQQDIMNKYAIFSTPESDAGEIFNKNFFGNMVEQSGFALGTVAQVLSEELLTMGLSTEFSLAKLGIKTPEWMGKVVTKAEVLKSMNNLGEDIWKSDSLIQKIVQGAKKYIPLVGTVDDIAKSSRAGAGVLQLAAIGIGGTRRFLAESNMAFTEARMEAAGTYGDLYTKLYDEELNKTGQAPAADKIERMKNLSMDAAHDNFWVNSGILMVSNRIEFDNLFKKFSVGRDILGEEAGYASDVMRVAGKTKAGEELTKVYEKGALGSIGVYKDIAKDFGGRKAAWEVAKPTAKNIFKWETAEGLQEVFQDLSNNTMQNYYYDLYHGVKGADYSDSLSKAVQQEKQGNQGLKTFLMGALTGRLISPIDLAIGKAKLYTSTTSEQRQERKANVTETVDLLNGFYTDPNKFLNEHIANVKIQNKVAKNMDEAIVNRDQYNFQNNKNSGFARTVSAAIKTDMFEPLMDTLKGYAEKMKPEEFKEAFGMDATEDNMTSVNEFFSKITNNVKDFHTNWKSLKERYSDLVMPDLYKDGTPERKVALYAKKALDDSIEMLATIDFKSKKALERAIQLKSEVAAIPQYGGSAEISFRNLGNINTAKNELSLLQDEITNLENVGKTDRATKQLIKTKKKQLDSLESWVDNYDALEKMGLKEKRRFNKAIKSFTDYINSKNEESNLDVTVKKDDFMDVYDKFLDYMDLNKDHKDYIDAYNTIADPIQFTMLHDRIVDAITKTEEKFKGEHKREIADKLKNEGAEETSLSSLLEDAAIDETVPTDIEVKDLEEKPKEEKTTKKELDVNALETDLADAYRKYVEQRKADGLRPASPSEFIRFSSDSAKVLDKYEVDKKKIYITPSGATADNIDDLEFKYGTAPVKINQVTDQEVISGESTEETIEETTPTDIAPSQDQINSMDNGVTSDNALTTLKVDKFTLGLGDKLVNGVDPEIQIIGFTSGGKVTVETQGQTVEVDKQMIADKLNDGYTNLVKNPNSGKFTASQINRRDLKQNPRKKLDNGYIPYVNQTRGATLNQSNIKDGLDSQIDEKNKGIVEGKKVIDGAFKVNNRLDDFETEVDDKGVVKRKLTGINKNYPLAMATDQIKSGTILTIKVDTDLKDFDEYEYLNSNITQKRTKSDYFTKDGKIKPEMVSEFPIVISTEINGKEVQLGYIPTEKWVAAKYNNGSTVNIVDKLEVDGVIFDNYTANIKKINDIRKEIMDEFNSGKVTERQAIVSKKSDGRLRTESGLRKLSEVVHPDSKLAIIKNGVPYLNADTGLDDIIDDLIMPQQLNERLASKNNLEGWPMALVKTPTGKTLVSWVNVPTLKDEHIDFILESWKAFHKLKNMNTAGIDFKTDSEEYKIVNAVYKAYGSTLEINEDPEFKILQDYINDYITYTTPLLYDPSRKNSSQITILANGTLVTWAVETGRANDDKLIIKNPNQLTQDNQNKFYNKAALVYYNVKFDGLKNTGINSEKKMTFLSVTDGKLVESPSMTYNEHMMNLLETNLAPGIPVDSNDPTSEYVHFSNPVINFDFTTVTKDKPMVKEVVTKATPVSTPTQPSTSVKDVKAKVSYKDLKEGQVLNVTSKEDSSVTGTVTVTDVDRKDNFIRFNMELSDSTVQGGIGYSEKEFNELFKTTETKEAPSTMSLEDQLLGADFGDGLTDFGDFDPGILGEFEGDKKSIATKIETLVNKDVIKKQC